MIVTILRAIDTAFNHLRDGYHDAAGNAKNPTVEEQATIESEIAAWELVGRLGFFSGGLGFGATYVIWGIPYLGPIIGLATGTASVGASIIGYDGVRTSKNLQPFALRSTGQRAAQAIQEPRRAQCPPGQSRA